MVAFTKENIADFMGLLLSIDTSAPPGRVVFDIDGYKVSRISKW
jgi:hypothetical protein